MGKRVLKNEIEVLKNQIELYSNFHITDLNTGKYYFVFDSDEEDTIAHFHIKELPGYIFALWHTSRVDMPYDDPNVSDDSEWIFFTQYERDLDKFKPSRSGFVIGIEFTNKENPDREELVNRYDIKELLDILHYMKKYKYKSYVHISYQDTLLWQEMSTWKAYKIYKRDKKDYKRNRREDNIKRKQQYRAIRKFCRDKIALDIIVNSDECRYPYYEVEVRVKNSPGLLLSRELIESELEELNKFEVEWFDSININYIGMYNSDNELTKSEEEKDKELCERFYTKAKNLLNDRWDTQKLVYTNTNIDYVKYMIQYITKQN